MTFTNMIMLGLNRWNMNKFLFVCVAKPEKRGHMLNCLKSEGSMKMKEKLKNNFKNGDILPNLASLVRGETWWIYLEVRWSSKKAGV